jgi:hypothetical protein
MGREEDLGDIWMAQKREDGHQRRLLELIVLLSHDGEQGVHDASLHEIHLVRVGAVQHADALRAEIACAPGSGGKQAADLIDVGCDEALLVGGILVVELEHHLDHCQLRLDSPSLQFATHPGQDLVRVRVKCRGMRRKREERRRRNLIGGDLALDGLHSAEPMKAIKGLFSDLTREREEMGK